MRKRYIFYTLAILSSVFTVFTIVLDTFLTSVYQVDPFIYGLSTFIVGTLISILFIALLMIPVKRTRLVKFLDPNFSMFRILKGEEVYYHILAGMGNALSTAGYFYIVVSTRDPSTILPYMQLVVIYLVVSDFIIEKDPPSLAEFEALLMVSLGALLASISPMGKFRLLEFLIVILLVNPSKMIQVSAMRKLRLMRVNGLKNDSINIRIWNLILSTLFFTLVTLLLRPQNFIEITRVSINLFLPISLVMLSAFMANVTYIRALGIGKSSVTQAITSLSIILSIPLSIILHIIAPAIFPPLGIYPNLIVIKIIGAVFLFFGIVSLAVTEVKAIVLIKAYKGGTIETLHRIWKIKGVKSVSALAGEFDFVLKIKLRTLGKAYSRIIRKLEEIEDIEDYVWMSVLREIEEI